MNFESTSALSQKSFLRGSQQFQILPDGNLECTFKRLSSHRQLKIPLWQIDPNAQRIKYRAIGPIFCTVFFGVAALTFVYGCFAVRDNMDGIAGLGAALAMCVTAFVISFWKVRNGSLDCVSFVLRQGSQLIIWYELPNAQTFHAFCETLAKRSAEAWENRPVTDPSSLTGELRELQRLHDSQVLTNEEFVMAKAKLLGSSAQERIGFR